MLSITTTNHSCWWELAGDQGMPGSIDGLQQKVGLSRALWHSKFFYSSPGAFPSWHLVSLTAQGRDSMVQFYGMFSWVMLASPWVNMPCLELSFTRPLGSDYLQHFSLPIAQSSCLRISFEEEGVETCQLSSCSLRTEPCWGQRQAVAKPCLSAELPPGEHVMGLIALWSSTGTGEAGARLCATRPWVYPGALISSHPSEWKFFRALFIHPYVTWLNCAQIQAQASE